VHSDKMHCLWHIATSCTCVLISACIVAVNCGIVQVYDATNGTRERREWLLDVLSKQNGFKVMFVESVCSDSAIVDGNIRVCFVEPFSNLRRLTRYLGICTLSLQSLRDKSSIGLSGWG